jgi:hypothetical protein
VREDRSGPNYSKKTSETILSGFTCQERVSVHIEKPGLFFTSRFAECVVRLTDPNVYESGVFEHCPPAFARKAAGDSSGPKIDVAYRTLRHRLTIGDIAEL